MSSPAPQHAQVYVYHADSKSYEHIGVDMNREKLMSFSLMARKALAGGSNIHSHLPHQGRHCLVFQARMIDVPSAKRICKWIENNDMKKPQPLTRHWAVDETFPDIVKLHFTGYRFYLTRRQRGSDLYDDLVWYFKAAPLRADEFIMLMEYCGFDARLCNAAMNDVMFRRVKSMVKGRRMRCPEEADIVRWARAAGIWGNMKAIELRIRESFQQHDLVQWQELVQGNQ